MTADMEALAAIVHSKGWPHPVTLPLRPAGCNECDDAIRTARAVLRSDWLSTYAQAAREDGVRQAMAWLQADYPYGTGPEWREQGVEWISDRLADSRGGTA